MCDLCDAYLAGDDELDRLWDTKLGPSKNPYMRDNAIGICGVFVNTMRNDSRKFLMQSFRLDRRIAAMELNIHRNNNV